MNYRIVVDFSPLFTLHFATINTQTLLYVLQHRISFTLHFATINTLLSKFIVKDKNDLHYTLLLLILI